MTWIKYQTNLTEQMEVIRMADLLGEDRVAVAGRCMKFWSWVDQVSPDGNALSVTQAFLDETVQRSGFVTAMQKVGWIVGEDGNYSVPNFDRHNGQTAKKRALTQKRVQKFRNASVTQAALPEKRREDKNKKEKKRKSSGFEIEDVLNELSKLPVGDRDRLKSSMVEWIDYKKDRKEAYKSKAPIVKILNYFNTVEDLERAIDRAIGNNWKGCMFETSTPYQPKNEQNPRDRAALHERARRARASQAQGGSC